MFKNYPTGLSNARARCEWNFYDWGIDGGMGSGPTGNYLRAICADGSTVLMGEDAPYDFDGDGTIGGTINFPEQFKYWSGDQACANQPFEHTIQYYPRTKKYNTNLFFESDMD